MPITNIIYRLLRINQYVKNCFVFFPAFFGGLIFQRDILAKDTKLFFAFCLASSFIYIINDIKDKSNDKNHPIKRFRPIASGAVSTKTAIIIGLLCLTSSISIVYYIRSLEILICLLLYIILNIFYTFIGKNIAIIDVVCLAMGFVLRVLAGSIVTEKEVSQWLIIMVFLLCVFLALGKRWHDLRLMEDNKSDGTVRKAINEYTKDCLLSLLTFFAAVNTICYIVYSVTINNYGPTYSKYFFSTALWVILGNMRYLQIILVFNNSYSPTQALFYDKIIRYTVIFWALHISLFVYKII